MNKGLLGVMDMKPVITDTMKASFDMILGWTFIIWLLFFIISSIALIIQA